MNSEGIYLYCFARPRAAGDIGVAGLDDRNMVSALPVNGIAAVFSSVPLSMFTGRAAEINLRDPAWVVPRACQHERVVEAVMRRSPVLPVRFGAVFSSRAALENLLLEKEAEISQFLDNVSDKEEWSVKAFLDAERAKHWISTFDAPVAQERPSPPSSPGTRYFHEKRLLAAARSRLNARRHSIAEDIIKRLTQYVVGIQALPPHRKSLSGKDTQTVLNCALLLFRDRVEPVRACLDDIQAEDAERGLVLEVSGPWPPYSFCPSISGAVE